jgi:hypothetical protein
MSLDFQRIKEVKLTDVLLRYKIPLRFKTDYAVCPCPLPTHKAGDTGKNFSIHLQGNYWRCFSDSCNANNGGKRGGDVINFVALMDGCREKDAAAKLADWFKVSETKTPARTTEQGRKPTNTSDYPDNNKSSDSVKYMASIDKWFDELVMIQGGEEDPDYWARIRKGVKSKLVESYRAGQKSK